MSQILTYTRWRLKEWGRWSRHENSGWPSISPMFRLFSGGRGHDQEPPKDVMEIDGIVRRADTHDKMVLIVVYCQSGSMRERALRIGVDRRTLGRHLENAEWYVHAALDSAPAFGHFVA